MMMAFNVDRKDPMSRDKQRMLSSTFSSYSVHRCHRHQSLVLILAVALVVGLLSNTVHCFNIGQIKSSSSSSSTTTTTSSNVDSLKLVILIHRHGDRTPIDPYPRDPYKNVTKYWPDGLGQLTLNGKQRMYSLGQYLSRRYQNFLGKNPREVSIRSSASDRCLESVQLLLSGLYPPEGRWKWNKDLGQIWQPFPVQTVPHETDGMLNPGSKCVRADQVLKEIYQSTKVLDYYNSMKSTLLFVADNTGYENVDLIKAEEIFDVLLNEKLAGYQLPAWCDQNVYEKLEQISSKTFVFSGETREIQKFRAGLLLKEIWYHLSNLSQTVQDGKRLFVYSTHDTQLSVFLSALNEFNGIAPPYGSTIMIELHQNQHEPEPYLEMFYLNITETEKPFQLSLNNCKNLSNSTDGPLRQCSSSNFHVMVKDLIPNDWSTECENPSSNNSHGESGIYLTLALIALCIITISFITYVFWTFKPHDNQYRLLPVN